MVNLLFISKKHFSIRIDILALTVATNTSDENFLFMMKSGKKHDINYKVNSNFCRHNNIHFNVFGLGTWKRKTVCKLCIETLLH